ncbi:MAG TPA: efflux RND transporter periplasmic adaptor subunit [Planctomycetes bacterium]|nr:efflux RND transporter periplasmic adaptor subunit [Planctomycetota bacterium]
MKKSFFLSVPVFLLWGLLGCSPEDHHEDTQVPTRAHEEEVHLSEAQLVELGIVVKAAAATTLTLEVSLPGEIVANADRLAHIVPRIPGVVREVRNRVGDRVESEDVMAILDSRELAAAKSKFLASETRVELAQAILVREENLWKKKIGSEQEYLHAKNAFAEARIALREGKQALHALGLSEADVKMLSEEPDTALTRYEIRAPFSGEVIERHIVRGEMLKEDSQAFVVADLGTVWVNLTVYQKYLPSVHVGQTVRISPGKGMKEKTGVISYVSPLVEEATRTATARVVLDNENGQLRPGLFVTAVIISGELEVDVAVERTALTEIDGKTVVFIETDDGFAPREVKTGRSDETLVEITEGLSAAEAYVVKGVFSLKSELEKETFGDGHGH